MLDYKNALSDTDGDFDKAVEALPHQGRQDVGKRAERATAEGLVAAKNGVLIELNSETDFVAKNADFKALADKIVDAALDAKAADLDALKAAALGDGTVEQAIADLSAKIGEKLELRRVQYFDGNTETYLHKRARTCRRRGCARRVRGHRHRRRPRGCAAGRGPEGQVSDPRRCPRGSRCQRAPHRRGDRKGRGCRIRLCPRSSRAA